MVSVTYYCPHCGALTSIERDAYLADKCVTAHPLDGWEYASTTEDYEDAEGIEFVCLGDVSESNDSEGGRNRPDSGAADEERDGCGRTFYLSYVKYDRGQEVDPGVPTTDGPNFGFIR